MNTRHNSPLPVVIAGGGIGGLATALCLAKNNIQTVVLEKAEQFGELGAGIQLGPNAFACFDYMGIGEIARKMAVFIDALRLMDAMNGNEIIQISLGETFRKRFNNPYAVVHRGDLHRVLLDACRSNQFIKLCVDSAIDHYLQQVDTVTAVTRDGQEIQGALLIGADGLHSRVRQQIVKNDALRISGHTTYRSVIPVEQMPQALRWNAATLWAGPKCHLVHYPLSDWKAFNLVITCHNDASEPVAGETVERIEVEQGFKHIHPDAYQIIELADDWRKWVLCDRDPTDNWLDKRVALLGDAAHPMLQYMAQGACMAMEDALWLSHCIHNLGCNPHALLEYQQARLARTTRLVLSSRAMGDHVYHPAGAHANMRDSVLQSWDETEYYHRLQWLYGTDWMPA